jgi:hypothetical protein
MSLNTPNFEGDNVAFEVSSEEAFCPLSTYPGDVSTSFMTSLSHKTLVLYVFHIYNKRVKHFIENAVFEDNYVDFMIICNDPNIVFDHPNYVKVLYRNNIGYDFGGWSEGLFTDDLYKKYQYFVFVNSSVSGPFLQKYPPSTKWTDIFVNRLTDKIRLFGCTINATGLPPPETIYNHLNPAHVQSYLFCINYETLMYLIECDVFGLTNMAKSFNEAIGREVRMSSKILEVDGWNIGCMMNYYEGVDFSFATKKKTDYNHDFFQEDTMYSKYQGIFWNLEELIFVKGNRF